MVGAVATLFAVGVIPAGLGVVAGSALGRRALIRQHRTRAYQWLLAASAVTVLWHASLMFRLIDSWIEMGASIPVSKPAEFIAVSMGVVFVGAALSFVAGRDFSPYASVAPLVTAVIYFGAGQVFLATVDRPVGRGTWFLAFLPAAAAALSLAAFWEAASGRPQGTPHG